MPAFIFISGYFSKKDAPWQKTVQKVLVPYLAFQTIYYLYYAYFLGRNSTLNLPVPKFSLWYLLALFVWKIITPYYKKIPHFFWLSLLLGLGFGCLSVDGTYLSISRIFVFYPYFLAGMLFERDQFTKFRTKRNKIISLAGIGAYLLFAAFLAKPLGFRLSYLYGKSSYESLGQENWEGILIRLLAYVIGFFFTYAFVILVTEKETIFSKFGSTTISIYLFHGLLFKFFERKTTIIETVNTIPETLLLLAFCVSLAFIFSLTPFCKFANFFSNISFKTSKKVAQ